MAYKIALAGNPNSGKTTLFNKLTGGNAKVSNWHGVTVDKRSGKLKDTGEDIHIIDLPGIYSLSPFAEAETIARNFIVTENIQLIVNVADATNLERSLYLTTMLMELDVPVVLALNMMDELRLTGGSIDIRAMQNELGIQIIPMVSTTGEGLPELIKAITSGCKSEGNRKNIYKNTTVNLPIERICNALQKTGCNNLVFNAVKLLEGDPLIQDELYIAPSLQQEIDSAVSDFKKAEASEFDELLAELRYKYIDELIDKTVARAPSGTVDSGSDNADAALLHKVFSIPIFLLVMFGIFQITFGFVGSALTDLIDMFFSDVLSPIVTVALENNGVSPRMISFAVDGVLIGVGTVLTFVPQVVLLFMFLSILEDIGYTARIAFMMDGLLSKIGLSGNSLVPMIMGFGCSVPAIMAARSLPSEKDRRLTILITPFMSCGARLPVYAVFAGSLFAGYKGVIVFSLYLLGVIVSLLSGAIVNLIVYRGSNPSYAFELPPYRKPSFPVVVRRMLEKSKDFIVRAGTIMFSASAVIWFLTTFNIYFNIVEDSSQSIFASIGEVAAPIFAPLGFGTWQASVALLTGFVAKEAVVATLAVLYATTEAGLIETISTVFTPLTAYAYMVFVLLYLPCVSAFAVMARELKSLKWTVFAAVMQTGIAWFLAFAIYRVGSLFGL